MVGCLLFQWFVRHFLIIIIQAQFTTFSALQPFIVRFLTAMQEFVSSPISIIVVVRINSISPRPNFGLFKHELLVS